MVGNKKDKVDEKPETRIMSVQEGHALAEKWGAEYVVVVRGLVGGRGALAGALVLHHSPLTTSLPT